MCIQKSLCFYRLGWKYLFFSHFLWWRLGCLTCVCLVHWSLWLVCCLTNNMNKESVSPLKYRIFMVSTPVFIFQHSLYSIHCDGETHFKFDKFLTWHRWFLGSILKVFIYINNRQKSKKLLAIITAALNCGLPRTFQILAK